MFNQASIREQIQAILQGQSPQKNYQQAFELALERAREVQVDDLVQLGVIHESRSQLVVPSLNRSFYIDLLAGTVVDQGGQTVRAAWAILVLHYLVSRPGRYDQPAEGYISFTDIPQARGYAIPYEHRVIDRFLHTAGRDQAGFQSAAGRLGGEPVHVGDVAFEFRLFPQVRLRVIWYRGDEETGPGASFLFNRAATRLFCVEDIVVVAELLVSTLSRADKDPWIRK